ncbi:CsbD family protein [Streptomyces sp. 8N706]|uniref:CsbD family protein n=1 Tax=Streptomyces sp. 8N706 TaxID=3457416 RepID=UPI003FD4B3E5
MSTDNKAKARTERVRGKVEEAAGRVLGSERLIAEGRAKQSKGDMREAGEKAKDAFRR